MLLNEGKAYSALGGTIGPKRRGNKRCELEPRIPEAGWALLSLYYVEGRRAEAHRLAMALQVIEPDPRDRAATAAGAMFATMPSRSSSTRLSVTLEPIVRKSPHDLHMAVALGLATVRNSQTDAGLTSLRNLSNRFPDNPDARESFLLGLDEAGKIDDLAGEMGRLPQAMASDLRFDRYRGAIAQQRQDWNACRRTICACLADRSVGSPGALSAQSCAPVGRSAVRGRT